MELFLVKVLGDALAPDPIDVVTNNGPLVATSGPLLVTTSIGSGASASPKTFTRNNSI